MGINEAFSNNADFGLLINDKSRIKISTVMHKAYIAVDEKGTEASGATALKIVGHSLIQPPAYVLKANQPFGFFISDCNYNVYFVGKFNGY